MKKLLFIYLITSTFFSLKAQMGVNTDVPAQALHVSGENVSTATGVTGIDLVKPTIRVDGLNRSNNTTIHTETNSVQPVYVNGNGDVLVKKGIEVIYETPFSGDYITTPVSAVIINSTENINTNLGSDITVVLTESSHMNFSFVLTASVTNTSGTSTSVTSLAKLIGSNIQVVSGPTTFYSGTYPVSLGNYSVPFTSSVATETSGILTLPINVEVVLPAGTYVFRTRGWASQGEGQSENTRVNYGVGKDRLTIYKRPL